VANNRTQTESVTPVETDKLLALLVGGRYSETENLARSLIDRNPMSGFVWKILGIALSIQGKSALYALQKTAEFLPGDAEAHNNLAMALRDNDQLEEAVNSFRGSLEIKPDFAGAYANLGNALKDIGHLHEAAASCRRALEIKPDYAEANSSLGNILHELRQFDAAAASFRRALELRPDFAEAHSNLGHLLRNIGQTERAAASCQRALEIDPNFADAALNLSLALRDLDQLDSAVKAGRLAVHIKPDCANASFNLSALLLAQGQFAEAWPLYEFRHKLKQGKWGAKFPDLTFPQWRGESLAGKSLLIWPEQGYGDYVQFVRYAPLLKQMGVSRLTLACSVQLKALLETVEGADMVTTDL
jgi:tetratricopeptide (TPR) repeat protein